MSIGSEMEMFLRGLHRHSRKHCSSVRLSLGIGKWEITQVILETVEDELDSNLETETRKDEEKQVASP